KALLFLGSGSVIHSMEHALHHAHQHEDPQDMRNMGGLGKHMKITAATFVLGAAALAGVPGLSGFFSKEEILTGAWGVSKIYWLLGIAGAVMTAFYMTRQVFKTFFGRFRLGENIEHHLHESPIVMTLPLMLLAVGAVGAGWIAKPFQEFLSPVFQAHEAAEHAGGHAFPMMIAIAAAAVGIVTGCAFYAKTSEVPGRIVSAIPGAYRLLYNKYYVDEIYDRLIVSKGHQLSRFLAQLFDVYVVDGLVNGVGKLVAGIGEVVKQSQTSYVRNYALTMVAGVILLVGYLMIR
ncbi:MAG: NADH-quinone oxidoreductase subunit L, partial [Armatimonadetes bacterium]|nr:NADH-quinone oxidoreductase subunit L [Armatimonadota bacterium]